MIKSVVRRRRPVEDASPVYALWVRVPKGGARRPYVVPVRVVGRSRGEHVVVERVRGFRLQRETVNPKNLREIPTVDVGPSCNATPTTPNLTAELG